MDINELLKGKTDCKCGKVHSCDIKHVIIKSGAADEVHTICGDFNSIVITADKNTFATCGERVVKSLGDKVEAVKIFDCDGFLIPNEEAIDALDAFVSDKTDLIIGIGSGVINDLCKYVSFKNDLPYYIVATAPSMDGYASVGAAMITGGMKTTFNARVPAAIIGDVDILKDAPMDMIKSGFGDIIGKYSALNDWRLAHEVIDEYICEYVYNLTYDTVLKTRALAGGIEKRDPETIKTLMEALVIVGIAMAYVDNSRPASGSEHHLSHYFEITGIVKGRDYLNHGLDVVYLTVETQTMREKIIALSKMPEETYKFDREKWIENIKNSYGVVADGVIALQDKMNYYGRGLENVYREKWDKIIEILKDTPSVAELNEILNAAGLDFEYYNKFYGRDVIDDADMFAKDLKDRYTVLWIYFTLFAK